MRNKGRSSFNWVFILVGLVAAIGFCFTPALAEDMDIDPETGKAIVEPEEDIIFEEEPGPDEEITDESFGQNYQVTWIPHSSFVPISSSTEYYVPINHIYFTGTTDMYMDASINLPSGAYLSSARLYYRDSHMGGSVRAWIYREASVSAVTVIGLCSSTPIGTPGYTYSTMTINSSYRTIANRHFPYTVRVHASHATPLLSIWGVRLYWKRQIRTGLSHPFTDIGSLPAEFQNSIAALRASGITTGTTPTTYSPNMNVTRAQMAVFLARALGLYWSHSSGY